MKNVSTFIRSLYSPEFAQMLLWFFNNNLTLGFVPWVAKSYGGFDQYDKNRFISTSLDYEKASALYQLTKQVVDGKLTGEFQHQIECNKQAMMLFECRLNQRKEIETYLTLKKQGEEITFRFNTDYFYKKENGKIVQQIIHSGLGVFMITLESYLTAVGANRHLNKLTDEELGDPQEKSNSWS